MDADAGADDPYTTDCSSETTETNPNAYSEFTIVNGELVYDSIVCVEKPPGTNRLQAFIDYSLSFRLFTIDSLESMVV